MLDVAGHTQVDEEVPPALELDNQIFPATTDRTDPFALQLGGYGLGRLGASEPGIRDLDPLEPSAGQPWCKPRADGLDFRKLGQAPRPPVRR